MLCETCGPLDAHRPSGTETRTINGTTHKTRECASGFAANEEMKRTKTGYIAKSGRLSCDDCFMIGKAHSYAPESEPHPNGLDSYSAAMINLLKQQEEFAKPGTQGGAPGRRIVRPKKSQRAIAKARAKRRTL